jgi:hypothetical protein
MQGAFLVLASNINIEECLRQAIILANRPQTGRYCLFKRMRTSLVILDELSCQRIPQLSIVGKLQPSRGLTERQVYFENYKAACVLCDPKPHNAVQGICTLTCLRMPGQE